MPATSANVTRSEPRWYRRALERPKEPSRLWALLPRRISQNRSPRKSTVGPKLTRMFSHHGAAVSSGTAFTTTRLRCRSCASAFVSANDGTSVLNLVVDFEPEYDSGRVN